MNVIHGVEYCAVVLSEGKIAHICWIYFQTHPNRWFNLKPSEAHFNYGYTFPEYRGKNHFPIAVLCCAKWLKEKGYDKIKMDVHVGTKYMVRSIQKIPESKYLGYLNQWFIFRPKFKDSSYH